MGKSVPPAAAPATATVPSGDAANAYVAGSFTAVGQVSRPFCFYGPFNVVLYPVVATALTTTAATATKATVASGTNIVVGQTVVSANTPPGGVVALKEGGGTTITIGGLTTTQIAAIVGGTDANATFIGTTAAGADATIELERSFDGGTTWVTCSIPGTLGTAASFHIASGSINSPVSLTFFEPENNVAYRLNCTAYSAGTIGYRISATGGGAQSWVPNS